MSYVGNETSPQLLTNQDLDPSFSIATVPPGAVVSFARQTAPAGWVECDGTSYSKTNPSTAALYAAIGGAFGETGTHFNVPDLRGQFVRSWDHGRGVDTGRAFGSDQDDALESHTHVQTVYHAAGGGGNIPVGFVGVSGEVSGAYSTKATGGTETRPKNVALLYCIKL